MNKISIYYLAFSLLLVSTNQIAEAQNTSTLTEKQKAIALISSFTAKGDLVKLKKSLNTGLDSGLTINECKEVLVHVYAYCGFPRSIQGLNTLIAVLDERKAKGIKDTIGREAQASAATTSALQLIFRNERLARRVLVEAPFMAQCRDEASPGVPRQMGAPERACCRLRTREVLTMDGRGL